jgi:serine kinase of HPr protein (carbohydrate metabolism regulator)
MSLDVTAGPKAATYIHATALLIGERGIVIRGPSGSGKTSLALLLIAEAGRRGVFARLVGDDRVSIGAGDGVTIARRHPLIAGFIERRTFGITALPFEAACVVKLVVDLCPQGSKLPRLPDGDERVALVSDLAIPRLRLASPPSELSCHLVFEKMSAV